jgi:superfamily I DNA and/or RNA helicase
VISPFLVQLLQWEVISQVPSEIAEMQNLARQEHQRLSTQHSKSDLPALNDKVNSLRTEIQRIAGEVFHIDERLAKVERDIISNASIVGATLTKTYLSDDIQARKFDTVILDEASMAPIPALWAAALLSKNSLVIVGDFRQLPPIVLSKNELMISDNYSYR